MIWLHWILVFSASCQNHFHIKLQYQNALLEMINCYQTLVRWRCRWLTAGLGRLFAEKGESQYFLMSLCLFLLSDVGWFHRITARFMHDFVFADMIIFNIIMDLSKIPHFGYRFELLYIRLCWQMSLKLNILYEFLSNYIFILSFIHCYWYILTHSYFRFLNFGIYFIKPVNTILQDFETHKGCLCCALLVVLSILDCVGGY